MPPQPVTQPSTPSMDNDVVNLAKAIRQTESGGDFNAKGGSGESGAYQWMPGTWKAHAKQALGNENAEMSPSNQNAVAYTVLKSWKDQGLNPAQIAAKWNSGSEVGWENKRGTNSAGVQYDVPKYVKSVTDAYQTVKAGGQTFADPNNPSSIAAPQPEGDGMFKSMAKAIVSPVATMLARPFQAGAELLGASAETVNKYTKGNFGDWVAPVPQNFSDVKKDVGRAAQTVALGMGPVSGGAAFGAGMSLEQGNDLMSTETAINTGLGLAGGKLLDLVGKPLLNGAGKAIGVITPAILKDVAARGSQAVEKFMAQHAILPESVGGAINKGAQIAEDVANAPFKAAGNVVKKPFTSTPEEVIAGREKALFDIEQKYAGMRKNALYSKDGGVSSRKRIADTDVLVGAVDENGLIRTRTQGGAYDQYKAQYVEPGESVVMDLLEKEARSIDLAVVERNLIKAVKDSKLAGKDHLKALNDVKKEIEGYRLKANKDGRIDLAELHRQKIGTTAQINWNTPPVKSAYRKAVAKGLKRTIEKESRYNIREANEELGKYYEDLDFLESLDGKIVNRGKMGKYFAQIAGNIAGGIAGGMSGGMTGSAIGTIVGGELASRIQGIMLSRSLGGAAGKGASRSAILEKAVAEAKAPRLALPAPKPGALRSEITASKPINLSKETDSTRQLKESQNPNIQTTQKGYQSKGKVEIKGIDSEGNVQIIDKGNVVVIPADELPVIEMGSKAKTKSDLPTIDYNKAPEGPKVSTSLQDQRSRKGTQKSQKIASPIKKPSTINDRVQGSEKKATAKNIEIADTLKEQFPSDFEPPKGYELKKVKIDQVKPTQKGADFVNSSSEQTAKTIKAYNTANTLDNQRLRRQDVSPIKLDSEMNVVDGNHRVAAAQMNKDGEIYAFVPSEKTPTEEMVTIYRGQNESKFSLDASRQKVNNMKGTSFTREKGLAEAYTLSGRGNTPTIIEGTIPKSKILKLEDMPESRRYNIMEEVEKMSEDDIVEGSLVENIMDDLIPYAESVGKEAIDMSTFFRNLVDEIRIVDSSKSFKLNKGPKSLPKASEGLGNVKLYRAGDLSDPRGTGIFLSKNEGRANSYETTGAGGKTTKEYSLADANLKKAENRWKLIKELDPKWNKSDVEWKYIQAQKRNEGKLVGGLTAEQRTQAEAEKRIRKILSEQGYDGVEYSGGVTDQDGEYQIFNKSKLISN